MSIKKNLGKYFWKENDQLYNWTFIFEVSLLRSYKLGISFGGEGKSERAND